MKDKLYQLMNWAQIEGIVYSDEDKPGEILGPKPVGNSILYQAFFPDAKKVTLVLEDKQREVVMDLADEAGFYAAMAAGKKAGSYHYKVKDMEGNVSVRKDPYAFPYTLSQEDVDKYRNGIHYELYKVMGSHVTTVNGETGVSFAVWVPGALRISVVGSFNNWDGRVYSMNRVTGTEIFTLFIPGLDETSVYQYEVKEKGGSLSLINDPYAEWVTIEGRTVSQPHKTAEFTWSDSSWIADRSSEEPVMAVYEWNGAKEKDAKELAAWMKEQGFSHVALPAVKMGDNFYQCSSVFADDMEGKTFVDEMHKAGVGVLCNWQTSVCHKLGWKEVSNYFIANVLYWMEEFHMDGLILSELETLLYLDYGKEAGQWCPNIFGGNENLEAVEFVKHTNSILTMRNKGTLLFADLDAIWPRVTDPLDADGLGFHYRYDTDFTKEFIWYLVTDPYFRSNVHEKLTERMIYAYREHFVMVFPHKSVEYLWEQIPGEDKDKFSTMKVAYTYISLLPGKVMSALKVSGQYENAFKELVKANNELNASRDVLAKADSNPENFQWINCFQNNDCTISFLRKDPEEEGTLLVVANFANDRKEEFIIGVPYEGKYQMVMNTEEKVYGGALDKNDALVYTEERNWDGFNQAVTVALEPLSVSVYSFIPYTEDELFDIAQKKAETIRLQLEEEARRKASMLRKKTLKDTLAESVEKADEAISQGSETAPKTETRKRSRKK